MITSIFVDNRIKIRPRMVRLSGRLRAGVSGVTWWT
jgi:hypothetical protein